MKSFVGFFVMLLMVSAAIAQNGRQAQYQAGRNYDPRTLTTIQGKIMSVEQQVSGRKGNAGVHLIVQTSSERITVFLGPQWYLRNRSITLNKGDIVKVEGSRVVLNNSPAIIARKLSSDAGVLELRQPDGTPLWSGQNNR